MEAERLPGVTGHIYRGPWAQSEHLRPDSGLVLSSPEIFIFTWKDQKVERRNSTPGLRAVAGFTDTVQSYLWTLSEADGSP